MSMCLVLPFSAGLLAMKIADLLSHEICTASTEDSPMSLNNLLSQTAWHAAAEAATYSASVVERAVMSCFFEF